MPELTNKQLHDLPLVLVRTIKTERKPSFFDQRRHVNVTIAEYRDAAGNEYRKAFESYGDPNVPWRGTNKEITDARKQW